MEAQGGREHGSAGGCNVAPKIDEPGIAQHTHLRISEPKGAQVQPQGVRAHVLKGGALKDIRARAHNDAELGISQR